MSTRRLRIAASAGTSAVSYTIEALRALSDEQLIREHDETAVSTSVGVVFYLEELERRSRERVTDTSNRLARQCYLLSVVTTILAIVATVVAVIALFRPSGA